MTTLKLSHTCHDHTYMRATVKMLLTRLMLIESKKRLLDQGRMLEMTICGPFALMGEEPEICRDGPLGSHAPEQEA